MKKKFFEFKWEVLITLIISCTSVFVAIKQNNISEMQTLIAKNSALPNIEVHEKIEDSDWSGYSEDSIIEISNLSGKMNNYQSEVISFFHCGYFDGDTGKFETLDVPIENYYLLNVKTGATTGIIEEKKSGSNYGKAQELQKLILLYNKENEEQKRIDTMIQSYLKISYINLLNEKQTLFFVLDPIDIKAVDSQYGQNQFTKYQKMIQDGYSINMNGSETVSVEEVLDVIEGILLTDNIYETVFEEGRNVSGLDSSWIINFICTLIGGFCTLIGGVAVYKAEKKNQERHAASILYYDLKSIEFYLVKERSSVNLRYSNDWQNMIANCPFLNEEEVKLLYLIYDEAYNYNYHYLLLEKTRSGPVCKEQISQYNGLKKILFEENQVGKSNKEYEALLTKLKKRMEIK